MSRDLTFVVVSCLHFTLVFRRWGQGPIFVRHKTISSSLSKKAWESVNRPRQELKAESLNNRHC